MPRPASRRSRLTLDLVANLVWPWLVLTFASDDAALGPRWGSAVAMVAPLAHALRRRLAEGRTSVLSVLVILSIALNAVVGFLPLDAAWFAAKEAILPVVFGMLFAATALRGPGLLDELLKELVDPAKVAAALAERGTADAFARRLRRGTLGFGGVLAGSGAAAGVLAAWMVRSPTGSPGFATELGQYTLWSYVAVNGPVLIATTLVLRDVLFALEDLAGQRIEELAL